MVVVVVDDDDAVVVVVDDDGVIEFPLTSEAYHGSTASGLDPTITALATTGCTTGCPVG